MLLQIAEGLLLRTERRRKLANLSICAKREKERDRPAVVRLGSTHDLYSLTCNLERWRCGLLGSPLPWTPLKSGG